MIQSITNATNDINIGILRNSYTDNTADYTRIRILVIISTFLLWLNWYLEFQYGSWIKITSFGFMFAELTFNGPNYFRLMVSDAVKLFKATYTRKAFVLMFVLLYQLPMIFCMSEREALFTGAPPILFTIMVIWLLSLWFRNR